MEIVGDIDLIFIPAYIILCITIIFIFKIYFLESENPSVLLVILCATSLIITVLKFPRNLGETLMAFASYLAIACLPSAFIVIVLSKVVAEFLIGARDFMGFSKKDSIEEMEEQLEALIVAGKFQEAINLLRERMKKYSKDHRYNSEIATISLMYLKDYKTALEEFKEVLKKTNNEEAVVFALYRMVDIYLMYMDDRKNALECLQRIIKNYPSSEFAKSAKIRLEFLEAEEGTEAAPSGGAWRMGPAEDREAHDMISDMAGQAEPEKEESPADWRKGFISEIEAIGKEDEGKSKTEEPPGKSSRPWTRGAEARKIEYDDDDDDF